MIFRSHENTMAGALPHSVTPFSRGRNAVFVILVAVGLFLTILLQNEGRTGRGCSAWPNRSMYFSVNTYACRLRCTQELEHGKCTRLGPNKLANYKCSLAKGSSGIYRLLQKY